MKDHSRRAFLQNLGGAGVGLAVAGGVSFRARGANDTVRIAICGLRSRGEQHLNMFLDLPGTQVAALCDVDQEILDKHVEATRKKNPQVQAYTDPRRVLERKDIDAVVIATPNHWHALLTVWACQAGKDVYVEKPVSHGLWEGRKMIEAARRYQRIVQAGFQNRSDPAAREAMDYIHQGQLGKILWVQGLGYKRRPTIGKVRGPQKPPASVDYNLWTGPAALTPLHRKNLHYDWHWVWETGNGDIGNSGVHEMDLCRWAVGEAGLPPRVLSLGGRFGYEDDGQTPNTQLMCLDYPSAPVIFEIRGLPKNPNANDNAMDSCYGVSRAIIVHCQNGYFAGGATGGTAYDPTGQKLKSFKSEGGEKFHRANFIQAVRERKSADLHAEIEQGYYSTALCHMANISQQLGTQSTAAEVRTQIGDHPKFIECFESMQKHLEANGVDLNKVPTILGPWLKMNAAKQEFYDDGSEMANLFLRRNYREPFVIRDQV